MVTGSTSNVASRHAGARRAASPVVKRCHGAHRTRPAIFRCATMSCCRSRAFSARRPARRPTTSAASPTTNRRTSIMRRVVTAVSVRMAFVARTGSRSPAHLLTCSPPPRPPRPQRPGGTRPRLRTKLGSSPIARRCSCGPGLLPPQTGRARSRTPRPRGRTGALEREAVHPLRFPRWAQPHADEHHVVHDRRARRDDASEVELPE